MMMMMSDVMGVVEPMTRWKRMLLIAAAFAAGVAGSLAPDGDMNSAFGTAFISRAGIHRRVRNWPNVAFLSQHDRFVSSASADDNDMPDPSESIASFKYMEALSETDAIRILRATPRYHRDGNLDEPGIRACHTAVDVLCVLNQYSPPPSSNEKFTPKSLENLHKDTLLSVINLAVDTISPNIAAAAVRRLSSPPFLSATRPSSRKSRNKYMNEKLYHETNDEPTEAYIRDQLMPLLMEKLNNSMENQLEELASSTRHRDTLSPVLLKRQETTDYSTDNSGALNWYAMADLLWTISSLCNVLQKRNRGGHIIEGYLLTSTSPQGHGSIMVLFEKAIRYLSWDNMMTSSFARCLGPKRLVRDIVKSLGVMTPAKEKLNSEDFVDSYNQLMAIISYYLALPHSLEKLSGSDLSTTLWSMAKIYRPIPLDDVVQSHEQPITLKVPQRLLMRSFNKRLRKFSLRSSTGGGEIVRALRSVCQLIGFLEAHELQNHPHHTQEPLPFELLGKEVSEALLNLSTTPTQRTKVSSKDYPNDPDLEVLHTEAVIMFHTLLNEIVQPQLNDNNGNEQQAGTKLQSLSLGEIADILQVAKSLGISHSDLSVPVSKILKHLSSEYPSSRNLLQRCRSCEDISRLLISLQRLRVGTGIYDGADDVGLQADSTGSANPGIEQYCVQLLGERFLDIVLWHETQQNMCACDTKTLAIILRSGVLMFQGSTATDAMLDAASILILGNTNAREEEEDLRSSFLSCANEFEVSNYLFALAMAKRFNEDVLISLMDRMTDLESCTPSSASRALWSVAMLLSMEDVRKQSGFLHERQVDLYHQLCPLLLFSPLSPIDISSAMWAMAKTNYVLDMGVFDHLAQRLASEDMLKRSNTRLVAQAAWSLGKMMDYDDISHVDEGEHIGCSVRNTYWECFEAYAKFLIDNENCVTPKQLAQTIWAAGRIHLPDSTLIQDLGATASHLSQRLNAREVANIVWGLSKQGKPYCNPEIVCRLIHRVINSPDLTESCSAQEATNMMFALGKLGIRDEGAFLALTSIVENRLHEATAQTVANTLWAHDVVGIAPPVSFLSW